MRSAKVGVMERIEKLHHGSSTANHNSHPKDNGSTDLNRRISDLSGSLSTHSHEEKEREKLYTRKELKEYRQLFNMFDIDGSGAIGNEELKQAILSIGMHANASEIDDIIKEVDADGNGEIDFDEFCTCMKKSQKLMKSTNEELIRECFDIFDQDGNGVITENEFKYIAREIGGFSDELAEKVFRELDVSSNGHLSSDQFATVVEEYLLSEPTVNEIDEFSPKPRHSSDEDKPSDREDSS